MKIFRATHSARWVRTGCKRCHSLDRAKSWSPLTATPTAILPTFDIRESAHNSFRSKLHVDTEPNARDRETGSIAKTSPLTVMMSLAASSVGPCGSNLFKFAMFIEISPATLSCPNLTFILARFIGEFPIFSVLAPLHLKILILVRVVCGCADLLVLTPVVLVDQVD